MSANHRTEIIAIASGKGGTGKTLIAASLGFALVNSKHRVLMIDADPATDGLSLFLLGPSGMGQITQFEPENTFRGVLQNFQRTRSINFDPHWIHRKGKDDHGVSYQAMISGKGLYGSEELPAAASPVPDLNHQEFQEAIRMLFDSIRSSGEFDYVIVDTRGGFAFESTDVTALADSFIIVTEPDYTSFYQDRTLKDRINRAANELSTTPLLKGIIVNKSTKGEESEFRDALVKEFKVRFTDTYPVALDTEAILAYQVQQIPYRKAPAARFCFDTLRAFSGILHTVTAQWDSESVTSWTQIVDEVKLAIEKHNKEVESQKTATEEKQRQFDRLESENKSLQGNLEQLKSAHDAETRRSNEYVEQVKRALADREKQVDRELQRAKERESEQVAVLQKQIDLAAERLKQREQEWQREQERLLIDGTQQRQDLERRLTADHALAIEKANLDRLRSRVFKYTMVAACIFVLALVSCLEYIRAREIKADLERQLLNLSSSLKVVEAEAKSLTRSNYDLKMDLQTITSSLVILQNETNRLTIINDSLTREIKRLDPKAHPSDSDFGPTNQLNGLPQQREIK